MDLNNLAIFQMARTRMDWVAQRQKVLAENIANADTPDYRAKDVRALDFKRMALDAVQDQPRQAVTHAGHVRAPVSDTGPFRTVSERKTFETSIDGNPVVLEEQVAKMAQGRSQYDLALNLVRKHTMMLKTALGRSGGA